MAESSAEGAPSTPQRTPDNPFTPAPHPAPELLGMDPSLGDLSAADMLGGPSSPDTGSVPETGTDSGAGAPGTGTGTPEVGTDATAEAGVEANPFEVLAKLVDLEVLNRMRGAQQSRISQAQDAVDNPWDTQAMEAARQEATEGFDETRRAALADLGVAEDDPRYGEYMRYLEQFSVDRMSDTEWWTPRRSGDTTLPSGREEVMAMHEVFSDAAERADAVAATGAPGPAPAATEPAQPRPAQGDNDRITAEQIDQLEKFYRCNAARAQLETARDRLAEEAKRRQGKLGGGASQEYTDAYNAYLDAVTAMGQAGEDYYDAIYAGRTRDQKNAQVVAYLLGEAQSLRDLTNEKWENTRVNKICTWMAKGNFAQRTAKGMLIGAGAASAIGLVTFATAGTGTVGAVIGGGAAAGGVFSRMMRTYGAVRGRELQRGKTSVSDQEMASALTPGEEALLRFDMGVGPDLDIARGARATTQSFERSIKREQKANRKATYWSVGAVAMGAAGADLLHLAAGHTPEYVSDVAHMFQDRVHALADRVHDLTSGVRQAGTSVGHALPKVPTGGVPPIDQLPNPPGSGSSLVDLIPNNPNAHHLLNPENFKTGVDVPLHHGDGIIRLSERYGLSPAQQDKLMHVLAGRHDGSTYWHNGDLRLNYGHRGLHLSGPELTEVLSAH